MALDPNSTQFDYLYAAIQNKYPGMLDHSGDTFFQFSAAPMPASWLTGNDINAYDIGNSVPGDLGKFYMPGGPLDTAYRDLLLSIMPAEATNNPDYVALKKALDNLTAQQQGLIQQANEAYYTWAANNQQGGAPAESKQVWLQDAMGGQSYGNQLGDLQTQITEKNKEMSAILLSMDAALSAAIAALGTDTMPISTGGPAQQVPSLTISGNLAADKTNWDANSGQPDLQVQITGDSVITSPWKTVYTTTVKQNCYETSTQTNINVSRIITDVNYKLEYSAIGFQSYQITRGKWYDETFVNPNVQITSGAAGVTNDTFFGVSGTLHMIPQAIVVIYKPTIKLTVSTEVYKQQFEANASADINWVNLLGSHFNVDGMSSLQPVVNADSTTTLTFASPDNADPEILGIISKAAYNGN